MATVLITPESVLLLKDGDHITLLRDAGFEIAFPNNTLLTRGHLSEEETIEELSGADAVIAGGECFTPTILEGLPKLRVIARSGVGYDRVDVAAATERGVVLTITPTANFECVAEHAIGFLFAVFRETLVSDAHARAGRWPMQPLRAVRGSTLGIVGLGRIGRAVAIRAKALRMTVIATEKYPDDAFLSEHGIELVDLDPLLERSDVVSLHCPLNEETTGLFDRNVFAKMKPGSVLINTARGQLVVEKDLYEALRSGHLSAVGLDVFEEEPPSSDNPLFTLENCVFSPHNGGVDNLSNCDMPREAAECIVKLHRGEWPEGAVVNDSLKGKWTW